MNSTSAGSNVIGVQEATATATVAETAATTTEETTEAAETATTAATGATSAIDDSEVIGSHRSPAVVMGGLSSVLSAQQMIDADFATRVVRDCRGVWPFSNSWYYPASGPKLSELNSRDPTQYLSVPVLLFMPINEFPLRFDRRPCAAFGYQHKRVVSKGYTVPCRVVGTHYTYAMVGNRNTCLDCKELKKTPTHSTAMMIDF